MKRSADFPRVLAAEVVSNFGSMLSRLAIPWIATLSLGATPAQMAWLLVADVAAGMAASLWLGVLVDRRGKRAVMVTCDLLRAALIGAVALLAALDRLGFAALVVAAAGIGVLSMAFELARSAWIAQCVEEGDLTRRNSQLSMGGSLAETAAFALGGWIYQGLGAVLALVTDAISYALSALALRGVAPAAAARELREPRGPGRSRAVEMWAETREGLAALASSPALRTLAAVEGLLALAMSVTGTSYMIYVARDLGFDTGTLGMIFATGGLGSVLGAWMAPRLGVRHGPWVAIAAGIALFAAGAAFIPLATGAGLAGAALLVAHQIVGDGGYALADVHGRTVRQTAVRAALLARVDAGLRTVGQAGTLAGALAGGAFATAVGTRAALAAAAALGAAAALVAALRAWRDRQAGQPRA